MKHVYVHRAVYLLATLLVVATAVFAWARSEGVTLIAFERERIAAVEANGNAVAWAWADQGEAVWVCHCRSCHGRLPHVPELFLAEEGRSYLMAFVLFGYRGTVLIDGQRQALDHPAFGDLSDAQIAAVLNHALVRSDDAGVLPEEPNFYTSEAIATVRERALDPQAVAEQRPDF